MKPRSTTTQTFLRTFSTRRRVDKRCPGRPPHRPKDPLINNPNAIVSKLTDDENLKFIQRRPPTLPSPYSLTTAPTSPLLRPAPLLAKTAPDEPSPARLPPLLRPSARTAEDQHEQRPRVPDEIVAEIRRLRLANPGEYSRGRLARMFGCTEGFVAGVAALPKGVRGRLVRKREEEHERARSRWGERKELVRAVRAKRREEW